MNTTKIIEFDLNQEASVLIEAVAGRNDKQPTYLLTVGDYVANIWSEVFPTLSSALARVALLQRCLETDKGFLNDPTLFLTNAINFMESELA